MCCCFSHGESPADAAAADVADPLGAVRVLQPLQGQGPAHRPLSRLRPPVPQRHSDTVSPHTQV